MSAEHVDPLARSCVVTKSYRSRPASAQRLFNSAHSTSKREEPSLAWLQKNLAVERFDEELFILSMATDGFLLDFSDFKRTLWESSRSEIYCEIRAKYLEYRWTIVVVDESRISISISEEPPISVELAYEKFQANRELHEAIYHRAMSIWR